MSLKNKVVNLYQELWNCYGPQGWWPVFYSEKQNGYHQNSYGIPSSLEGKFEICIGAILTQNTRWNNVEKALNLLFHAGYLSARKISDAPDNILNELIRPTGFFHQKVKKLKIFSMWWTPTMTHPNIIPHREDLLNLWGIGEETADSILCYAYHQPIFVVDTYTRRLFKERKIIDDKQNHYRAIQKIGSLLENSHSKSQTILYQEFHALIVHHSKVTQQTKGILQTF